jgi:hypothetical protein
VTIDSLFNEIVHTRGVDGWASNLSVARPRKATATKNKRSLNVLMHQDTPGARPAERTQFSSSDLSIPCALFEQPFPRSRDQLTPNFAGHLIGTTFAKAV